MSARTLVERLEAQDRLSDFGKICREAAARIVELEAQVADTLRLRKIEHAAWHVFDDSEQLADGQYLVGGDFGGNDLQELFELLPEDHPENAPLLDWMKDAALKGEKK